MPGKRNAQGLWHGYAWSKEDVEPELIDKWGANIGIRAEMFPGLDIDSEDAGLTHVVQQEAERFLGPAPVRQSRAPRALLMYRADEPIKKQALTVIYKGQITDSAFFYFVPAASVEAQSPTLEICNDQAPHDHTIGT